MSATATRGVKWTLVANLGRQLFSFASVAVLARLIGPDSFGLVSLATIWTAFLDLFVNQGMSMAIIQRREVSTLHLNTAFWTSVVFASALALLSVAGAPAFGAWMGEPKIVPIIQYLSLSFPLSALTGVQVALLNRSLDFKSLAQRTLIATGVAGVAGILCAVAGMGVWSLVVQQLTSNIVQVVVLWRTSPWRPSFDVSLSYLRDLFGFSSTILVSNIFSFFSGRIDQLVIGKLIGSEQLGLYTMAKRLPLLIGDSVRNPVSSVAVPVFARIQDEPDRVFNAACTAQRVLSTTSYPIFALLGVSAPVVVHIVFGVAWLPAAPALAIFAAVQLLGIVSALSYPILMAAGRPKSCLALQVTHTVGAILAAVIGHRWGALGIAWSLLLNCGIVTIVSLGALAQLPGFRVRQFAAVNFPAVVGSAALFGAVLTFERLASPHLPLWLQAGLQAVIGGVVYLLVLRLIAPKNLEAILTTLRGRLAGKT